MTVYNYHDSSTRTERLTQEKDYCQTEHNGVVFDLAKLVSTDGRVTDPGAPDRLLSSPRVSKHPDYHATEPFIYAVSEDLGIHIARDSGNRTGQPGLVKHETLFHNANVLAAGELQFDAGEVVDLNDASGSYGCRLALKTNPAFAKDVLAALRKAGVRISTSLQELLTEATNG